MDVIIQNKAIGLFIMNLLSKLGENEIIYINRRVSYSDIMTDSSNSDKRKCSKNFERELLDDPFNNNIPDPSQFINKNSYDHPQQLLDVLDGYDSEQPPNCIVHSIILNQQNYLANQGNSDQNQQKLEQYNSDKPRDIFSPSNNNCKQYNHFMESSISRDKYQRSQFGSIVQYYQHQQIFLGELSIGYHDPQNLKQLTQSSCHKKKQRIGERIKVSNKTSEDSSNSQYIPVKLKRKALKISKKIAQNSAITQQLIDKQTNDKQKNNFTCKKSKCIKKYCQCYTSGKKCQQSCQCLACQNS